MMDFLSGGGGGNRYTSNKEAFDRYGNEMDKASERYNPYINRGNEAGQIGLDEYKKNIADPNAIQDKISSGFQMSPYQKYMQDLVTKRLNYNSANSGMQGSGAANRALMDELTKSTGQFENDYVNRGLGVYGQALNGLNSTADLGFRGLNSQDALIQEGAGGRLKGDMSENETNDRNRAAEENANSSMWGNLIGIGGSIAGGLMGGPAGSSIGSKIGSGISGMFKSGNQPEYGTGGYSMAGSQSGSAPVNTGNWSF